MSRRGSESESDLMLDAHGARPAARRATSEHMSTPRRKLTLPAPAPVAHTAITPRWPAPARLRQRAGRQAASPDELIRGGKSSRGAGKSLAAGRALEL